MPLPTPSKGEGEGDFVGRCVGILKSKGEGTDDSQRAAVCHSQYKRTKAAESLANMMVGYCPDCGEKMEEDSEHECEEE